MPVKKEKDSKKRQVLEALFEQCLQTGNMTFHSDDVT